MNKVRRSFSKLAHLFPSKLPIGRQEFDKFTSSIFEVHNIPALPSYKTAIASMILHAPPHKSKLSKHSLAVAIRKAQANEVAYALIEEDRELAKKKRIEEEEKLKLNKPDETHPKSEPRLVEPIQNS